MSDRDVLDLLDRAGAQAPPMSVAPDAVVGGGRRRVRRRQATAAGMGLGSLALAGAVWVGAGSPGLPRADVEPSPAATSEEVDAPTSPTTAPSRFADGLLSTPDGRTFAAEVVGQRVVLTGADGEVYDADLSTVRSARTLSSRLGPMVPVDYVAGWPGDDPADVRLAGEDALRQRTWSEPYDAVLVDATAAGEKLPVLVVTFGDSHGEPIGERQPDGSVRQVRSDDPSTWPTPRP